MDIDSQIENVDFSFRDTQLAVVNQSLLCIHMEDCPVTARLFVGSRGTKCDHCIGSIQLPELKNIEPELTKENLAKTIKIYEVLVK